MEGRKGRSYLSVQYLGRVACRMSTTQLCCDGAPSDLVLSTRPKPFVHKEPSGVGPKTRVWRIGNVLGCYFGPKTVILASRRSLANRPREAKAAAQLLNPSGLPQKRLLLCQTCWIASAFHGLISSVPCAMSD